MERWRDKTLGDLVTCYSTIILMFLHQFPAAHRPVVYPGWSLVMPTMARGAAGSMPPWNQDTSEEQPSLSRALHASMVGSFEAWTFFVSSTVAISLAKYSVSAVYTCLMAGSQVEESEGFVEDCGCPGCSSVLAAQTRNPGFNPNRQLCTIFILPH